MLVLRGERFDFDYTPVKLSLLQHQINQKDGFYYNYPPPQSLSPTSFRVKDTASVSPPPPSETPSSGNRISPAVLFVIVILAVLFFISGILHLLVRFLTKNSHPSSSPTDHRQPSSDSRFPDFSSPDALQRQLQQLFHLHDSGLDQAFIDALPVFLYKEIVGPTKEPFDCAVCLCEFTEKDKLRLLPMCSHAFHINCIDTWLLSNSTCPLCRGTLFTAGFSMENPIFEYDGWRGDIDAGGGCGGRAAVREGEMGFASGQKAFEIEENGDGNNGEKKGVGVFPVRLGKFRKQNDGFVEEAKEGETSNVTSKNLDDRRCYSMGSYQYVVGDTDLRVTLCPEKNHGSSSRHVKFAKDVENNGNPSPGEEYREGKKITNMPRRDSYSVSKIWLWKKKGKYGSSSSNDAPIPMDNIANSLNMELPWMDKAANV